MSKRIIEVELIGDAAKLEAAFTKGSKSADSFGKGAETSGSKWSKLGTIAKGAALGGVALLGDQLKESVDAAKAAQVSQANMQNQLKSLDISYKENAGEITESTEKLSALSGISKVDLQGSFTALVRTTGNVTEALKDNALAADIARGKHIQVAAAAQVLAKVENGQVTGLKKLGIAFQPVTTAQDKLKASTDHATAGQIAAAKAADATATKQGALAALQDKFGGSAKAYGDTAAGAQDKFKNSVEELQVRVGTFLIPILTKLSTGLVDVADWFGKNKTAAIALGVGVGALGTAIVAIKIANFASDIGKVVTIVKEWTVAQTALDAVMDANPVVLVTAAVVALAAGAYEAYQHSETFRHGVDVLFDDLRVGAAGPLLLVEHAFDAVGGVLSGLLSGLSHIPGFGWADKAADEINHARDAARELTDKIAGIPSRKSVSVDVIANIPQSLTNLINSPPKGASLTMKFPGRATGGYVHEALTLVGEKGPELVSLPTGSYVHTAADSRRIAAQSGASSPGGARGLVVNFNGPVGSQQAAKVAALQLAHGLSFR